MSSSSCRHRQELRHILRDRRDRGELSPSWIGRAHSSHEQLAFGQLRIAKRSPGAPQPQERRRGQRMVTLPLRVIRTASGMANAAISRAPLLRQQPLAFVLGLLLLLLASTVSYIAWDYARHLQSTDDAFIAARQYAITRKVSGYITTVPVTDNQHVAAGDVIARIDDRDCRTALSGASCAGIRAAAGGTLPVAGRQGFGQRSERPAV